MADTNTQFSALLQIDVICTDASGQDISDAVIGKGRKHLVRTF